MNEQNQPAVGAQPEPGVMQHTPGPWRVVVDEHPHRLGGVHVERRISTTWDHAQMKGPLGVVNMSVGIGNHDQAAHHMVSMSEADAILIAAAPELLAALQALRLAREQDKYPSWEKGMPEFNKAEALADAAIAKALTGAA